MLLSKKIYFCFVILVNVQLSQCFERLQNKLMEACCKSFCPAEKDDSPCCNFECPCPEATLCESDLQMNMTRLTAPDIACRKDDGSLILSWEADLNATYFLEVVKNQSEFYTSLTTNNQFQLDNLADGNNYKIRLWAIQNDRQIVATSDFIEVNTIPLRNKTPSEVPQIFIERMILKNDSYDVVLKWTPAEDFSCHYELLVWFNDPYSMGIYRQIDINEPSNFHTYAVTNLEFGANISVGIRSKKFNPYSESNFTWLSIDIPSCLEAYANLDNCAPEDPKNLTEEHSLVKVSSKNIHLYDLVLHWSKPTLTPNYYIVSFMNVISPKSREMNVQVERSLNISGEKISADFRGVELGPYFHVGVTAWSSAGPSKETIIEGHLINNKIATKASKTMFLIVISVVAALISMVLLLVGLIFFFKHYQAKKMKMEQRCKYFNNVEDKLNITQEVDLIQRFSDEWELEYDKIQVACVLGEGAFGIVRKGLLRKGNDEQIEVAIKMLKIDSNTEERRYFLQEIEIMKSVKCHPHIVSLIGCVTDPKIEGPLLVVEYCSRGDLQTLLRTSWNKVIKLNSEMAHTDSDGYSYHGKCFTNRTYDIAENSLQKNILHEPKYLLGISRQISLGMEHLAKTRVVHRDLATRNVLVCEDYTVKVSDFGLSRDVYRDNVYCKIGGGKLPVRWMALESLTHQIYTTQSDVWSFGVLLWEIVTLGALPYAGIQSRELIMLLRDGYRLEKPSGCAPELYQLMRLCWDAVPANRPTFTHLCKSLEDLLENISDYINVSNICHVDSINRSDSAALSSSECYIKPKSRHSE